MRGATIRTPDENPTSSILMAENTKSFMSGLGKQVVGGIVMTLVGALLTLLLRSGGQAVKQSATDDDVADLKTRMHVLETEGSPVERARLEAVEHKVDDIYSVIVLKQMPQRRQ
jgi:hypothetical protein